MPTSCFSASSTKPMAGWHMPTQPAFAAPFSCAEYGLQQRYFQKAPAEMPEMPETPKRPQIEGVQAEQTGGRKLAEIGGNPQDGRKQSQPPRCWI
jgi:hypothetical protein